MTSVLRRSVALTVALAFCAPRASAHDGPPYPIFVDEPLDGWTISIWTDPDVGTGTFYYYVEPPEGRKVEELVVRVVSSPVDGESDEVSSLSVNAEEGEPFQLVGELEFSHRGVWDTRFEFETSRSAGSVPLGSLVFPLDVTPPGLGTLDILWFAFPFLAVGALWLKALLAQRAHDRTAPPPAPSASG